MARVLTVGSVAYDRIMDFGGDFTEHIVPGKLHSLSVSFQVDSVVEHFGGCAANVAYNLARLGDDADILATVGSDFDRYEEHLINAGVGVQTLLTDPSQLTSTAHIVTDRANNQISAFALAAGATPYEALPDLSPYACAMISAGCIADSIALARAAKKDRLPYYIDPGQAVTAFSSQQLREIITGASGLFCNDYELSLIEKHTGWDEAALLGQVPLIIVTLGEKGARIRTADEVIEVHAAPVGTLVDPTGAGDAHRAGFIKGLIAELPLKACGQLAATVAVYAIEVKGTQNHTCTLKDIRARYEAAFGEKLGV